jgi:hypothetical protein
MVLPMQRLQDSSADLKILIGPVTTAEYVQQGQERALQEASAEDNERLTCYFCNQSIGPDESINLHHPIYKSRGGTEVVPSHEQCHRAHHSEDFREWGKLSSLTRAWAFNLKNVRNHPAYAFDRAYYSMLYTH